MSTGVHDSQYPYGHCTECGEPIPEERLSARPATTTCVRCAAARRT
ncbi:TraR/DksA family transcriptional regulator [Streptomyces sp. NPDC006925]